MLNLCVHTGNSQNAESASTIYMFGSKVMAEMLIRPKCK